MSQIVKEKRTIVESYVLAAIADEHFYVESLRQAEKLARKHGLRVADMPMIKAAFHPMSLSAF